MKDPTNLELSPGAMRKMAEAAVHAVVNHIAALPNSPRSNLEGSAELVRSLREPPPENGTDFRTLLEFLMTTVIPASINTPHPQYIAYIPGGGLYPSAVADFIGAATNRYTGVWFAAPASVRLETNVLEWFAQWMGYPETARGILTTGGSMANFSAVVAARKQLLGDDISRGTIYASDQTHHCVMKVASLAGIPERNVRLIETDERYRALPELFEKAIRADVRAGCGLSSSWATPARPTPAPSIRWPGSPRSPNGTASGITSTPPTAGFSTCAKKGKRDWPASNCRIDGSRPAQRAIPSLRLGKPSCQGRRAAAPGPHDVGRVSAGYRDARGRSRARPNIRPSCPGPITASASGCR